MGHRISIVKFTKILVAGALFWGCIFAPGQASALPNVHDVARAVDAKEPLG